MFETTKQSKFESIKYAENKVSKASIMKNEKIYIHKTS